ncbi:MAG: hypothetical protein ACJ72U_12815 [Nitrososphaeraceae archaeon]
MTGIYGEPLICPECKGQDFKIYRANVNTLEPIENHPYSKNKEYEVAECNKCGLNIQTFALKTH